MVMQDGQFKANMQKQGAPIQKAAQGQAAAPQGQNAPQATQAQASSQAGPVASGSQPAKKGRAAPVQKGPGGRRVAKNNRGGRKH